MENDLFTSIIKSSLWNERVPKSYISDQLFHEMQFQSIFALPGAILSELNMSDDLRNEWNKKLLEQVSYYMKYRYAQAHLPLTIPYVILKGTTAAQYYPHPEFRAMGDIDIMTRREDFEKAYRQLIENGYRETERLDREITLVKNDIHIELHHNFAAIIDIKKAKYLDDLIIDNINNEHVLPDIVNGLVLLEHISQHMENGLGFRQIIDWMMFVDKYLSNEKWIEFCGFASELGLDTLAVYVTRMCEIYFGLSKRSWTGDVDDGICCTLYDYIQSCGNFGIKKIDEKSISTNVLAISKTPRTLFKLLQDRGLANWRATYEIKYLRPFAWIYQLSRYITRGLRRDQSFKKFKEEYEEAKQRNKMLEFFGVCQAAKGRLVYKDGQYYIEEAMFR